MTLNVSIWLVAFGNLDRCVITRSLSFALCKGLTDMVTIAPQTLYSAQ